MTYTNDPGESIRALPRASASPGFTHEVMRRIRRRERRIPVIWRLAAGFAVAACLIAMLQVTLTHRAERLRMDDLRAEQQRIEAELQTVKEIAAGVEPVVVLENADGTRVIVDLDSAIQPASHKTWD